MTYWKYKTISDKVSTDIKKEFGSKPVCNKKNFDNQIIKSYDNEVTDFTIKKFPRWILIILV